MVAQSIPLHMASAVALTLGGDSHKPPDTSSTAMRFYKSPVGIIPGQTDPDDGTVSRL